MKPAPLLGMLSLFALLCVGLIGGMNALTSGDALTANTVGALGVSSSTRPAGWDPSRQVGEDGGERTNEPMGSDTDDEDVATTTIDLSNIQIQLPDWYVPIVIPTSTPPTGTTVVQPPVQPNDSAPRVLITQPVPVPTPVPVPRDTPATSTGALPGVERTPENTGAQEMISDIGASLRQFQREVRRVENAVRDRVTREVENAFDKAQLSTREPKEPSTRAFDVDERRRRIETLTAKLSQDVRSTIASGDERVGANELQPVLKSSLDELRLLIKADTGVDVDLSPSARTVLEVVSENTEQVSKAREELLGRGGLGLYEDVDRDGISNYDEQNIYNTDPQNAYTSGSFLTDGERVLLGFNVLTTDVIQVPVESPKVAGEVAENVFEVHTINVTLKPFDSEPDTSGAVKSDISSLPAFKEEVTFSGRALPNSFVTLYVFSTPVVVTVKADASGAWSYTLDTELEDGNHELYVATVDAGGRILAKSPAVPFVKRAEAAEFTPLLIPETPEVTPLSLLQSNLTLVGVVAFVVFALIALIILGVLRAGPKDPTVAV
ncbi:hypothetical protein K2P56_02340 [Patescibacteria group bacterium]|nr:hypothetical protein [Patescibacteria group bacterium]